MPRTTTVVIGAGQAGLAMSRCLSDRSVDHVVLERGRVANAWRTERWDSLRLLTPNWQTRLPGHRYTGPDPDGYMTMPEVERYLRRYADVVDAPVSEQTTVRSVVPASSGGYLVETDQGSWRAPTVVLATGACARPFVPFPAELLSPEVHQLAPIRYRNPGSLPDGRVLVVGASASGVQIADELCRSGRDVVLAVGTHARAPRSYRGRDFQWWLDATGTLDRRHDEVRDIERARRAPSYQLVGTPERRSLDLAELASRGARIVGRLAGIDGSEARLADDLGLSVALADERLSRMLDRFDAHARRLGLDPELGSPDRPDPIVLPESPERLDLRRDRIATVIWATGYRPHFPWLRAPVFDAAGNIRHRGGVLPDARGVYLMGMPFMRRRKSTFLDGVGPDAEDLSDRLVGRLGGKALVA